MRQVGGNRIIQSIKRRQNATLRSYQVVTKKTLILRNMGLQPGNQTVGELNLLAYPLIRRSCADGIQGKSKHPA